MCLAFTEARAPEGMRLYAIGDVHGRLDLLDGLHRQIRAELERDRPADWRVIHLGDYVDRGPQSRGVIESVIEWQSAEPRVLALAGNHEQGFLDFLVDPQMSGLFARFGGADTARSYGVELDTGDRHRFREGHAALVAAVPANHRSFLGRLAFFAEFGDFFFCHAGVRPTQPLSAQTADDLIWIREDFLNWTELFSKVVVHGHTPVAEPDIRPNRVNCDTGAFQSGVLSALVVEGREKRFLQERA